MKRSGFLTFLAIGILAILQGCQVTYVETYAQPAPVDPYPNATYISGRVNGQLNQINMAVTQGNLDQDKGALLAQNDQWVSRLASDDRADNPDMDLSEQQTNSLDNMLNDNGGMIQDAIQNREAWNRYFQNNNFDYAASGNSYMYLNYLDYRLNVQQQRVDAGLRSGQLSSMDAQILRGRIQNIRDAKLGYYRSNGRFDLSDSQVGQLSQMAGDNEHYLQYRTQGHRGQWDQQKFSSWKSERPQPLAQSHASQWGGNRNYQPQGQANMRRGLQRGRQNQAQAPGHQERPFQRNQDQAPAPQPTAVPTAAPAPAQQQQGMRQDRRNRGRRGFQDSQSQASASDAAPASAPAAQQPAPAPAPTAAAAQGQDQGQAGKPNSRQKFGAAAKNSRNKPAPKRQPKATPAADDDSKKDDSKKGHHHPMNGQ